MPEATAPAADAAPAPARSLPAEYLGADGAPDVARLWGETQALRSRIEAATSKYRETEGPRIREEVTRELEAQRRATLPGSPDGYLATLPDRLPSGAVLLREQPGEDFRPEPGRHYLVLNRNDPTLKAWTEFAHEHAVPPEQFAKAVQRYLEIANPPPPSQRELAARRQALYDALGETGEARVAHLYGQMRVQIGDERAIELLGASDRPEWIAALEKVVAAGKGTGFAAATTPSGAALTEAELGEMMRDPRYWRDRDPQFVTKVTDGFKRLYPSERQGRGWRSR